MRDTKTLPPPPASTEIELLLAVAKAARARAARDMYLAVEFESIAYSLSRRA